MSLKEHPDYQEETNRLKESVNFIEKCIVAADASRKELNADTKEAYIELDYLDSSLSYSRILINAKFLEMLEGQYDGLIRSQKKPYFARIDFQPEGSRETSKLYIGKMSLSKEVDGEPLIVDWRSPVASVYYDGRLGAVTYTTPTGTAGGNLHMKRQYTINDGVLEDIMDVDITTTDTFLQAALGESKDNRLKDIVSTIQAEQNEIIRADILYPLIVQGVAGSGKTTIALHRIAYLIYTYEETFEPDNFLIIAPNHLFLNYISEVLPELGAHHVRQSTFTDLVYELSGIKLKLGRSDEKLKIFIGHGSEEEDEELSLLRRVSAFKGSLLFRDVIDGYVSDIEQSFVPEQDFKLKKFTIYKVAEIKKMFLHDYSYLPTYQRIPEIKKMLAGKLKVDTETIVKEIQNYFDKKIDHIRTTKRPSEKRREYLVKLMDARDKHIETINMTSKTLVNKYISLFPKQDTAHYYKELAAELGNRLSSGSHEYSEKFTGYINEHNHHLLRKNRIEFEDLAAVLYLKHKLFGIEGDMDIKYIVLDEAQDFSLFQIYVLKHVFKTELFTMLGDIAQGIHSYRGVNDWEEVKQVFTQRESRFLTLEQSYRTTIEIMDAANAVLGLAKLSGLIPAKPVVRHGDKPGLFRFADKEKWLHTLENRLSVLREKQYSTIAVICKTDEECDRVARKLNKSGKANVKRLYEEDFSYEGGIVILPSYLAKGLEFDAVVVAAYENDYYEKELDIKLLYVAMTRALHSLDIICLGTRLSLMQKTSEELFSTFF